MQATDRLDLDSQVEKFDDHTDQLIKPEINLRLVNPSDIAQVTPDSFNKRNDFLIGYGKDSNTSKAENQISSVSDSTIEANDKSKLSLPSEDVSKVEVSDSPKASPGSESCNNSFEAVEITMSSNFSPTLTSPSAPTDIIDNHSFDSNESGSPSRKGFETEDSPKRSSQVDDFKRRGRAFLQGIVENFTAPPLNRSISGDSEEQSLQREIQIKEDRLAWKQLLQTWATMTEAPPQKKLRNMCWKGIPSSCRGEAWFAIIGNDLKITRDLYKILLSRTKNALVDSSSKEDSANLIEVDAPRTFPELKFFHGDGPLRAPLVNILKTYVSFRPDVGYIQGMSYIAAMLLLNLDDECNAFISLANLLNRELYFTLFRDFQSGRAHLNVFDKLLQKHVPRCAQKFKELQLTSDMYLYDWILTIFSRSFPLDIACRIWDCFLVYGQVFMFRAALGVLKMYERAFLQSNFEQCLHLLNKIPRNMDENVLFQNIRSISISDKSLNAMLSKVQTVS